MVAKTVHGKYSYDPYKALFADISGIIDQLDYRLDLIKDSFLLDK